MPGSVTVLDADGGAMPTYVAVPDGEGPFPAVAVAQHRLGVDVFMRNICDRLAEAGFVAAAPDLYHRSWDQAAFDEVTALPRGNDRAEEVLRPLSGEMTDPGIVADMNATITHLRALPQVGLSRVGVLGFCMGGRVSYLMATRTATPKAVVCFYPGNLFLPREGGPSNFAASDRITSPILGFFGKLDENPSPDDMERLDKELTRLQVDHAFHAYDGVAHAFMDPTSQIFDQAVADDAWPKAITFLNQHLRA